jgi:hypothetical protein
VRQVKRLWRHFRLEAEAAWYLGGKGSRAIDGPTQARMEMALELVATLYPDFGPMLASEKLGGSSWHPDRP